MSHRFIGLALALLIPGSAAAADKYDIDNGHTSLLFSVQHLGAAWTYGRFNTVEGTYAWDKAKAEDIAFDVVIQTESVDTNHEKRDAHLKGPDFFDVAQHPTITFKAKGTKLDGDTATLKGELTMLGKTQPIEFEMTHTGEGPDPWGGYRMGLLGELTIKRGDFGMSYMPDGLSDEVKITVAVEGTKAK